MKEKIEMQLNRLFISAKDMESAAHYFSDAARFIKNATDPENWRFAEGLIVAGIVAFGRPFSGNEPNDKTTSTPPFSTSELSDSETTLHSNLLGLRNSVIAHSDAEYNPIRFKDFQENGFLVSHRIYSPLVECDNVNEYAALARKINGIFVSKMFALSAKVNQLEV